MLWTYADTCRDLEITVDWRVYPFLEIYYFQLQNMATKIGMMDGAYFVGRNEILAWINDRLQLNLARVEQVNSEFPVFRFLNLLILWFRNKFVTSRSCVILEYSEILSYCSMCLCLILELLLSIQFETARLAIEKVMCAYFFAVVGFRVLRVWILALCG